jgi:2-keto-3-deoxy-L-rhamnonate aldolase RhmA
MKNAGKFREKVKRHQVCTGPGVTFYDLTVTDALCSVFDFVWIDMEHNAMTVEAVQGHIIATQGSDTAALVRVPSHDPAIIKTVLDIGADGIIVPNVRTPDEARRAVAACRYPPEGIRGFGPRRPSNYGRNSGPAFCKAANEAVLAIAQIEHIDAVRSIDEILAVPGLDSIVFGPNDLSGSMGCMGEPNNPKVIEAMETVMARARQTKVMFASGAGNSNDLEYWIKQGVHWMQVSTDFGLLLKASQEIADLARRFSDQAHPAGGKA